MKLALPHFQDQRVLVLGLSYKANIDDDRESPSYVLLDLFKERGAKVAYYDPHVPVIRPSREHGHWAGTKSVPWTAKSIGSYDAVVSVEMIEAVGRAYWPAYFRTLRERLCPRGHAILQAITIDHARLEAYAATPDFIQVHVFPGGMLPSIEAMAAEAAVCVPMSRMPPVPDEMEVMPVSALESRRYLSW